ncbi:MAG: DNA alkylation repair protein [Deferrisomatales bacterium]
MDVAAAVGEVEALLGQAGGPERAVQEKRYLKSDREHLGVPVPAVRRVALGFSARHPGLTRPELVGLVEALWRRGIHEDCLCGVELLGRRSHLLAAQDLGFLEGLLRDARTWALVDNLAAGPAAALVERCPELGGTLDRWAADGDFWVRRAALLALLPALRRGEGDLERFGRYADALLGEREFFLRKAVGWVLREIGKKRPEWVRGWLLPRAARASGLTVREAVRHLPGAYRDELLAARGGRGERRRT